jgi:hypothetical protein
MNGLLMSEGIDAVSIPAIRANEFNSRMVDFYISRNATEMMSFVLDCHPSAAEIYQLNPGIPRIAAGPQIQRYRVEDPLENTYYEQPVTREQIEPQPTAANPDQNEAGKEPDRKGTRNNQPESGTGFENEPD